MLPNTLLLPNSDEDRESLAESILEDPHVHARETGMLQGHRQSQECSSAWQLRSQDRWRAHLVPNHWGRYHTAFMHPASPPAELSHHRPVLAGNEWGWGNATWGGNGGWGIGLGGNAGGGNGPWPGQRDPVWDGATLVVKTPGKKKRRRQHRRAERTYAAAQRAKWDQQSEHETLANFTQYYGACS
ncbi:hypothetical protein B0H14DRAFT_3506408 [Mycena olivaceomarginata]|nr:hypothetical protein B0H14DRAFT_3506408 [Mycena olivaceomarginata]